MIVRNRVEERGVSSKVSIEYKLMNMCINSQKCIADITRHGKGVQCIMYILYIEYRIYNIYHVILHVVTYI